MADPRTLHDADIALAGEYALGLLSADEAVTVTARIVAEPDFAAEVAAWQDRVGPLAANTADAAPPAHVWAQIQGATMSSAVPAAVSMTQATSLPPAANDNRLTWWKAATGAGFATAAALALMLFTQTNVAPNPDDPIVLRKPMLVAALAGDTGTAAMSASFNPGDQDLIVTPTGLDTGKLYPEIWLIPVGGPRKGEAISLGMADMAGAKRIRVPENLRDMIRDGATLAITPEPAGGAPGGKATGPIILKGVFTSA